MISFSTLLTEDEILAVSYYVRSIARKPSEEGMMANITPDEQIGMKVYHHGS
ncbi:MAG: hypothetical protein ACE5EN_06055 [Nitrospinota bacterium]